MANFSAVFASGCAWRAVYFYRSGRKVAHLGIDPDGGRKPSLFGSFFGAEFRLFLPVIPWRYVPVSVAGTRSLSGRLMLAGHRVSSSLYHGLDGRYGWGRKAVSRG